MYLDTNIYVHLAQNTQLWDRLAGFLLGNDLCLAFSSGNVAELADWGELHHTLADLLILLPSAAVKTWDVILSEEVEAHPRQRTQSLLLNPFNQLLLEADGHDQLFRSLRSPLLRKARREQLRDAQKMWTVHSRLKSNFPPAKSGRYELDQAEEFAMYMVWQWLAIEHHDFLAAFRSRPQDLRYGVFRSVRLYGLLIFHKYYLAGEQPSKPSDFGDLFHLFQIPYCTLAIMEKNVAHHLSEIKRHHDVLDSTTVRNIDFLTNWDFPT
jgi:hypothetical protein